METILIIFVVLAAIGAVLSSGDDGESKQKEETKTEKQANTKKKNKKKQKSNPSKNKDEKGVSGIEAQNPEKELYGNIEDFSYKLSEDYVELGQYDGDSEILEIKPSYVIDGTEYHTDLSDFQVRSNKVSTLILDEGISEVQDSIFNLSDVQRVYFPRSMAVVYDNTLAYLSPDEGQTIKIYYGGTQEEWMGIFTEYQRENVRDAEGAGAKGKALADKLNEMIGHGYDSSLFEYFFSVSPDDLK